jgi:hypothetical protein
MVCWYFHSTRATLIVPSQDMCMPVPENVWLVQIPYRGSLRPRAETRLIFPYNVEKQRVIAISHGGDYTFMRNTVPITDSQPNVPSAMFLATADQERAVAAYTDAVSTVVQSTNMTYRRQFVYRGWESDTTQKRGMGPCHSKKSLNRFPSFCSFGILVSPFQHDCVLVELDKVDLSPRTCIERDQNWAPEKGNL